MADEKTQANDVQAGPVVVPATEPEIKDQTTTTQNPLDETNIAKQEKDSSLMQGIAATEDGIDNEQILESAPEIDESLLAESASAPKSSIVLLLVKILLIFLIISGIGSFMFFSSQLTDRFDFITKKFDINNASHQLIASNHEVIASQTELNIYRYLQAKAYLDEFSYYGDRYIQNYEIAHSTTATNSETSTAKKILTTTRPVLAESFAGARENLIPEISTDLFQIKKSSPLEINALFASALLSELQGKAASLENSEDIEAKAEMKNYLYTQNLVSNGSLKALIIKTDFDDLSDAELYALIKNVYSVTVNDLSIIQKIKNQRIRWSDVMEEIEKVTVIVDKYYSDDHFDEVGGIRYTSYDFDSDTRNISIVGETKMFDTTNFTVITNLIDQMNDSDFFAGAAMNSFSKSGSIEDGYSATLKLSLDLVDLFKEVTN